MKSWTISFEKKEAATSTRMGDEEEMKGCAVKKAKATFFKPALSSLDEQAPFIM